MSIKQRINAMELMFKPVMDSNKDIVSVVYIGLTIFMLFAIVLYGGL